MPRQVKQVRIHSSTLRFVQDFCPETWKSCLRASQQKPRSRMVEVEVFSGKCKCLQEIMRAHNLSEDTNDSVAKDLRKLTGA